MSKNIRWFVCQSQGGLIEFCTIEYIMLMGPHSYCFGAQIDGKKRVVYDRTWSETPFQVVNFEDYTMERRAA